MTETTEVTSLEAEVAVEAVPAPKTVAGPKGVRSAEKWDCRKESGLSPEKIGKVTSFHQSFARGLARSMSVAFRSVVEVEVSGAQETRFDELDAGIEASTFVAVLPLESQPSSVLVMMDWAIGAPCLDLLLGGSGEKLLERTELTDVDVQILSEMSRMIAGELQIAWRELELRFRPDLSVGKAARRLIKAGSKLLILAFTVKMGEKAGNINVALPAQIVEVILHTLDASVKTDGPASGRTIGNDSADILADIPVLVELTLPAMRVPARELVSLVLNSVLTLPLQARHPARLVVAGREMFSALPARHGNVRAAKIEKAIVDGNSDSGRTDLQ
jgi:flagellar motor switch protein FliM